MIMYIYIVLGIEEKTDSQICTKKVIIKHKNDALVLMLLTKFNTNSIIRRCSSGINHNAIF